MMDPEFMRLAQEQMNKIPPSELAKMQQQMMSNPDLIRMASESMKNMRPDDIRMAAEQMKHARPEDMAEISKKMANASPEELASLTAQADAHVSYVINGAQTLKKKGNELHNQGKYSEAAEKYLRAKNNLKDVPVSKGKALQMTCSLNLMSCYLKTSQFDDCITEGTEVLQYDMENVKALYRRGQAYKELGLLEDAVSDLSRAHSVSPDDETIAETLRDTKDKLSKENGGRGTSKRLVIEEITDEVQTSPPEEVRTSLPESRKSSSSREYSVTEPQEMSGFPESQTGSNIGGPTTDANCLPGLDMNPETLRSFQTLIANADPDTLAAMGGGNMEGMSPDMIKTASNMLKNMSPEELEKMLKMASSMHGKNPFFPSGTAQAKVPNLRPGSVPEGMSPDMLKTASDMMSKMSPEDLQRMFDVASNMKGTQPVSAPRTTNTVNRSPVDLGDSSSSQLSSNSRLDASASASSSFPPQMGDLSEQMRTQMNDPAMRQMMSSMIKNMSPDMMANMSEQFGIKMSKEEAEKAQQAMSSLSPDTIDKMMRWADRIQRGVEAAKKSKNWLFGRPGMILAIFMLVLASVLHRLGYIGS